MDVERTVTVPRPIEAVFDYLADFRHTEQWDPGTVETTRTSGDGGVGTTYHNRSRFLGRDVELDYETAVHDRPSRLEFHGRTGSTRTSDALTLTRASYGTATQIHYRAEFRFGRLVGLVAPLVRPRLERLADETVAQLHTALMNLDQ